MELWAVFVLLGLIWGYYKVRDYQALRAMHKRAIKKACLCGRCTEDKG
jgi:hypothetical protein